MTCRPCETAWRGAEADCWSCGRPATSAHHRHRNGHVVVPVRTLRNRRPK
ncbi:hypothetical protein [Streptomyces hoynatensis]|nr:hypothetical protein [Streptomyces hoynatensis]